MSTWQSGPPSKRKERDNSFDGFKTTKELAKPSRRHRHPPSRLAPTTQAEPSRSDRLNSPRLCHISRADSSRVDTHESARLPPHMSRAEPSVSNNQLLAGYLANEFLSNGTLFGQMWDPSRGVLDKSERIEEPWNKDRDIVDKSKGVEEPKDELSKEVKKPKECYMEVADLLKMGEVHLPKIVNPTQLVRFLQIGNDVLLN